MTAFLLVAGTVTVYTFTATPDLSRRRTQLLIEKESANVVTFKQVVRAEPDRPTTTTRRSTRSCRAARWRGATLDALKLWDHPLFESAGRRSRDSAQGVAGAGRRIASAWFTSAAARRSAPAADETAAQSATIDRFLAGLTIVADPQQPSRGRQVPLARSARWRRRSPTRSRRTYIEQNLEFKFLSSKEASRLARRSGWPSSASRSTRASRRCSATASRTTRSSLDDRQNIVVQKLADLNAAVTRAKTERIQKEAMYSQLRRRSRTIRPALDTFPAILGEQLHPAAEGGARRPAAAARAAVREARRPAPGDRRSCARRSRSPQAKLQGEIGKVVQSVRKRVPGRAGAGEQPDRRAEPAEGGGAVDEPQGHRVRRARARRGQQPADLREPDAADEGDRHLRRAEDQQHPGRRRGGDAARAGQRRTSATTCCSRCSAARLLAFGLAFFFEYLDNRIKTPDEMNAAPRAAVPRHGAGARSTRRSEHPLISNGVPRNFSGGFRDHPHERAVLVGARRAAASIVVTSTGPGEGKTMVAATSPSRWRRPASACC